LVAARSATKPPIAVSAHSVTSHLRSGSVRSSEFQQPANRWRGVDVRVMLSSAKASDMPIVQHASHRNFHKMLERGVRI